MLQVLNNLLITIRYSDIMFNRRIIPSHVACYNHKRPAQGAYVFKFEKTLNGVKVDRTRQRYYCLACITKYHLQQLVVPNQALDNLSALRRHMAQPESVQPA